MRCEDCEGNAITRCWFQPTHLKTLYSQIGSSSPMFGVNKKNMFEKAPARLSGAFKNNTEKMPHA